MTTKALTRTTPDKQKARTVRHYAKRLAAGIASAEEFLGQTGLTYDQVYEGLRKVFGDSFVHGGFRKGQRAAEKQTSLMMFAAELEWAERPTSLLVRSDELQAGDRLVEIAFNKAEEGGFVVKAKVYRTVAAVGTDGRITYDNGNISWPPAYRTQTIERG